MTSSNGNIECSGQVAMGSSAPGILGGIFRRRIDLQTMFIYSQTAVAQVRHDDAFSMRASVETCLTENIWIKQAAISDQVCRQVRLEVDSNMHGHQIYSRLIHQCKPTHV